MLGGNLGSLLYGDVYVMNSTDLKLQYLNSLISTKWFARWLLHVYYIEVNDLWNLYNHVNGLEENNLADPFYLIIYLRNKETQ